MNSYIKMTCKHLITKGKNKGENCKTKKCDENGLCQKHSSTKKLEKELEKELEIYEKGLEEEDDKKYKIIRVRVNPNFDEEFKKMLDEDCVYKIKTLKNCKENINDEYKNIYKFEYKNSTKKYYDYLIYEFSNIEINRKSLKNIFDNKINKSMWYKKDTNNDLVNPDVNILDLDSCKNREKIYVISKGRWMYNYTVKSLEDIGIKDYLLVVEKEEKQEYIDSGIKEENILVFDNKIKNNSGIPVRNFVWDYSKSKGEKYHWILDDNLKGFKRWNRNKIDDIKSPYGFRHIEDCVKDNNNVMIGGMNYSCFHPSIDFKRPVIQKNTRIYSCILLKNDIDGLEEQWRGLYNEDTDLSIRILKLGYSSMLFTNYLCDKPQTGKMKGGNKTLYDEYEKSGYEKKTDSLVLQHPDVVDKVVRFVSKKFHHKVDYKPFLKNPFKKMT